MTDSSELIQQWADRCNHHDLGRGKCVCDACQMVPAMAAALQAVLAIEDENENNAYDSHEQGAKQGFNAALREARDAIAEALGVEA